MRKSHLFLTTTFCAAHCLASFIAALCAQQVNEGRALALCFGAKAAPCYVVKNSAKWPRIRASGVAPAKSGVNTWPVIAS